MNAIQVLEKARALIVNKGGWCQGILHKKSTCSGVQYRHCVMGAIEWESFHGSPERAEAEVILTVACNRLFGTSAIATNDQLGHDAIILALDTAIGDYPEHAPKEPTAIERQASTITA